MRYRIEDAFDVGPRRYWDVFFDEDFNRALFDHIDIDRTLVELEREGEGDDLVIRRAQKLSPRRELPKILRKFVKGAVTYEETNVLTMRDNTMEVETIPTFLAEKVTARGTYRLEIEAPDRVVRVFDGLVECRIPLVGNAIEKVIVDEVRESYRRTTDFTRRWLREHPA